MWEKRKPRKICSKNLCDSWEIKLVSRFKIMTVHMQPYTYIHINMHTYIDVFWVSQTIVRRTILHTYIFKQGIEKQFFFNQILLHNFFGSEDYQPVSQIPYCPFYNSEILFSCFQLINIWKTKYDTLSDACSWHETVKYCPFPPLKKNKIKEIEAGVLF